MEEVKMAKKSNPWTKHVTKVKKANPKMKFSEVLKSDALKKHGCFLLIVQVYVQVLRAEALPLLQVR